MSQVLFTKFTTNAHDQGMLINCILKKTGVMERIRFQMPRVYLAVHCSFKGVVPETSAPTLGFY